MLSININKLRNEVEEREKRKTKIYEKILNLCYHKILNNNKQNDDYTCTYTVPPVVFGLPLYNVDECVSFVMNKLIEKGFEIVFAFPTTIHISWKPVDKYNNRNTQNIQYIENTQNSQNTHYTHYTNKDKQLYISQNKNKDYKSKDNLQIQQKHYKPIDDYSHQKSLIYDADDINLFQNKLDNIFT